MTVSSAVTRNDYTATGGQTIFPYTFETFASSDLVVLQNGTILSEGSQYTVSGVGLDAGGDITLLSGATASDAISVYLDMDLTRTTDYQNSGDFLASEVNDDFDRAWLATKQQQNSIDRSLRLPDADSTLDMALPVLASRKGTVLAFDETTGLPVVGPTISDVSSIASITADIARLADIEDGTLATDAIQTTAAISTNVTTVAGISANVTTVAGNTTNINTVAGIDANITTVAGVSANVTTVAGISADVTSVASNAADISTVATNIADVTNFADVYQGPSASDPTVRNDASALQTGDLYFNTTTNELRAYSGSAWTSTSGGSVSVTRFSGTGAQTAYTLPTAPSSENNTQVYVDGIYQQKDTYSVSGVTLTFSEAPPLDTDNIEVTTIEALALGATSSDLVSHIASGTGAVATTVQAKLRESVSVKDFGAVGDGVTDDTVAIQAALTHIASNGGKLNFPYGNYLSDSLTVTPSVSFEIYGVGTITKRTNSASNMLQIQGATLPIIVRGITLDGNFTTHADGGQGLVGYNISNILVDSVTFTDVKNSGVLIYTDGTIHENNIIRNCTVNGESNTKNGLLIVDCKNSGIETSSVFNVTEFALELKNSCTNSWIRNCLVNGCDLQAIALGQTTGTGPSYCDISNITIKASDGAIELSNGQYNTFNQITCDFTGNPGTINNGINCSDEVKNCTFTNITMLNLPAAIYAIRFRANNINNLVKFSSIEKDGSGDSFRFDASATLNTVVADRYSIADVLKEDLRSYVSDASSGGTNLLVSLRTTATENNDTPTGSNTAFNAVGNVINTQNKYAGKRVWNTSDNRPVYAVGSAAADVWKNAAGTTYNTPV